MIIQCIFVGVLVSTLLYLEKRRFIRRTFVGLSALLLFIMLTMLAGNFLQMAVWAALFVACGEFQTFDVAFYHSVVNFTSLGYGDVVMSEERRLLGALEAANGVMMFGLITAFLVRDNIRTHGRSMEHSDRQELGFRLISHVPKAPVCPTSVAGTMTENGRRRSLTGRLT